MPIYRNDGTSAITVTNALGVQVSLAAGESVTTNRYYDIADLTKTADTPYINPVAGYTAIDIDGVDEQVIELSSPDINRVDITPTSGTMNIYYQASANTPAVITGLTGTDTVSIDINGVCDKIVVESVLASAAGYVIEFKGRQLL